MRAPIPTLREKKACPNAASNTDASTLEKSGLNKNFNPSPAPSNVNDLTHNMIRITNKAGMRIFVYFSTPSLTPLKIMNAVNPMNMNCHKNGRKGLL